MTGPAGGGGGWRASARASVLASAGFERLQRWHGRCSSSGMPSPTHEAVVLLFRSRPELAVELLRDVLGVDIPRHERVVLASETLRQVRPVELTADAVVVVLDAAGRPVFAILVEVQLSPDEDKSFAWPCYLALLRRDLQCPCVLLVVALDDAVARSCERPISLGHPGFVLRPVVLGRRAVPRITDRARASEDVELAVLSAAAAGAGDDALAVVVTALHAIFRDPHLDDDRRDVYTELVVSALGDAARAALEDLMKQGNFEFQSDFFKRFVAESRAKGLAEGRAEGTTRGEAEALILVLEARGFEVPPALSARVRDCVDRVQLDRWIRRAAVATRLGEVFDD